MRVEIGMKESPANLSKVFELLANRDLIQAIDRTLVKTAAWVYRESMKAFDEGKQTGGVSWDPNSLAITRYKREVRGQNPTKVGIMTGAFRRSFGPAMAPTGSERTVGGYQIRIQSDVPYAKDFVEGTTGEKAIVLPLRIKGTRAQKAAGGETVIVIDGQPPRPVFPVDDMTRERLQKIGLYEIGRALKAVASGVAPGGGGGA